MSKKTNQATQSAAEGLGLPEGFYEVLPIDKISPGKNPRHSMDQKSIVQLSRSIKQNGLLQPIVVQPAGDDYEIICGERRYKAAMLAGLTTIPTIVRKPENDSKTLVLALVENIERENLNPIEEARGLLALRDYGYTQARIAKLVGRSQPYIANSLRLLNLPEYIQQKLANGLISVGHGKELLRWINQPDLLSEAVAHAEAGITTKNLARVVNSIPHSTSTPARRKVQFGEPIDFRGLRFAPVNEQGVVYLFGMVSRELGFLIESVRTSYPDCEGKKCVDKKGRRWEHVLVEFEYRSSHFRHHGHDPKGCDIIVCWIHDWFDCPVEVLELSSKIKELPDRLNPI